MIPGIDEIKNLAIKYSKKELAHMAQLGLVDPQKAVMAGMMRDRISQEDMKPPTSTVAQDVLGAPAQPQPQMGMGAAQPQPQAPSAGVEALPAGDVGNYAGGGIVAFDSGGAVPSYAGELPWGSLVGGSGMLPPPRTASPQLGSSPQTAESARTQENFLYSATQGERDRAEMARTIIRKQAAGEPLTAAEQQLLQRSPDIRRMVSGDVPPAPAAPTGIASVAPAPATQAFPLSTQGELLARRQQGVGYTGADGNPVPWIDARTQPDKKLPPIAPPAAKTPAAPATPAFKFPDIAGYKTDIPVVTAPVPKELTADQAGEERRAQYAKEGYDPEIYNKMIATIEEKKGEAATEKERAIGEAIMQAGFKLMGARKGQEFAALSEGAQEGLKSFQATMKEAKARQDKLDERMDAFRIADAQARRTGAESDIARAEKQRELVQKAEEAAAKAKNEAAIHAAQFATTRYGAEVGALANIEGHKISAAATRYAADAHSAVQGAYTQAIRQGQLDERRARTLIEAADHYIKNNADKPGYINKPQLLQQDAMDYAEQMERRFMSGQRGTSPALAVPTANRPSLSTFQK